MSILIPSLNRFRNRNSLTLYFKTKNSEIKLTKEMGKFIISKVFKTIVLNIVKGKNLMIVDAPILYETRILEYICFPIIVVGCSK